MSRGPQRTAAVLLVLSACAGRDTSPGADALDAGADAPMDASAPDGGVPESPPVEEPVTVDHCRFEPVGPTAGAGGRVEPGPLRAAAVAEPLDLPLGSTLGGYADRGLPLGQLEPVDERSVPIAGAFLPSVGIETRPMARVLVLEAGNGILALVKVDLGVTFDGLAWDVIEALDPAMRGKVIVSASHSHGGYGHHTANAILQVGFGPFRRAVHDRLVGQLVRLIEGATESLEPAHIGFAHDPDFDPDDRVNRDRRPENDALAGGRRKDRDLFVVRVDRADGTPLAILPVIGIHGTSLGGDNPFVTTDTPGAIERAIEESFDTPVVVMHLQGAGGDVSPAGSGGLTCDRSRCYGGFARAETVGRYAREPILAAWTRAGDDMRSDLAVETLSRPIELGPEATTFTVRDGGLAYAPFDGQRPPDRRIMDDGGVLLSPIDEFNAPRGAVLCGDPDVRAPLPGLPGTMDLPTYDACILVDDTSTAVFETLLELDFEPTPICASTRTTVAAVRLGEYALAAVPGEPVTLFADALRRASPFGAERTVVVGYAQDYVGYLLTAEDWLAGGYEPSLNVWGPLEGEYVLERTLELLELAATDAREDATASAPPRWLPLDRGRDEPLAPPDPVPGAGTVPTSIPAPVYLRGGRELTGAQPSPTVPRLESAFFVWIGEDPASSTPVVTLEREVRSGVFEPVRRRSGRPVRDGDLLLTWTPHPLEPEDGTVRTHLWAVEWQAVAPFGAPGLEDVGERVGVALGRYRFHVRSEAAAYEITSRPFEVVAGSIDVTAERRASDARIALHYHAPHGWRLLTLDGPSNEPVPLPAGAEITLVPSGPAGPGAPLEARVDPAGEVVVELESHATSIRVEDRFGNWGEADIR